MNPWGTQWQSAWQQHPHVYMPPQYPHSTSSYWDQPPWGIPYAHGVNTSNYAAAGYRSAKYPDLNPILATDTTLLRFDVAKKPRNDIAASTYHAHRQSPATAAPVTHLRLISRSFPWTVDIKATPVITCDLVWDALHAALQEGLADSEWGMIVSDEELRTRVENAARRREQGDGQKRLKRVDLLGRATMFKGLDKDDDFAARRLLPGSEACLDTWVVRLAAP